MDDTVSGPIRLEAFEMYPTDNTPEKIVQEFKYLLEKSHRLFITLREPTNTGKNWKPLFQSTFEVYSRLWKFQQVHRKVLENEQYYGLKRWELGELASKIGQLYYYYYLRTSDTSYLQESFTFYSAIQKRKYFEKVLEAKSSALIIKKLRYHIRYIVVCLLLNKFQLVHQLSLEFQDYIKKYEFFLEEKDAIEWRLLYNEISNFISAQQLYDVYYEGQLLPITSHLRYSYKTPLNPQIKLEQIVVVGNYEHHAKFSGLTLDMYGLLQSLEFDPEFSDSQMPELQSQSGSLETSEPTNINRNPEKHLLFRPTIDLLTLKLATCQKDMTSDQSALLLYLSGEGSQSKQPSGISMASLPSGKSNHDTINTFFPHDLISFTRKPMFVIVDSDNSMAFKNFRAAFDQPFLCILSPPEMPVTKDHPSSIFTVFLHCPLKAFCFVSNIKQLKPNQWQYAMDKLKEIELYIISLLQRNEIVIEHTGGGWKRGLEPRGWINIYEVIGECTMYEGGDPNDGLQVFAPLGRYAGMIFSKSNCEISLSGIVFCDFQKRMQSSYDLVVPWNGTSIDNTTVLWNNDCFWDDSGSLQVLPVSSNLECQQRCIEEQACTHLQTESFNITKKHCILYSGPVQVSITLADCATPCKFNTSCSYSFWDGNNCMLHNTPNTLTNSGNYIVYLKLQNCQDCTEYKIRNEHLQFLGLPNQTYYSNAPEVFNGFLGYNFNSNGLGKVFGNLHDWSAPECEFTEPLITFDNVDLESCYTAAVGSKLLFSYEYKGPYIDCVNYCAKQKSCIQFVWFSPVSFVFEGDCYSYESSVAVGDMVPYKGAVSGWIEGRLPCTIKGMNVTCDKSILSQNQSSTVLFLSKTATPIITTTPTINIDMLTARSTIQQSDFPTTTPVADITANAAGNSNDFGINASSTFNDAGLQIGHTSTTQPIVVTLIVNDTLRDNIQYHSKFQITTPIIAGLLVSALLNIILFVFLAKATWVYPQAKNPDSVDSSIPYSDKAIIPDRQFVFDAGSQNGLLESNYYPMLPRKSSFTNVITNNHHIYLIATMENAQDCLKLLEKLFLEFVSNSDSDIPGCLKISCGDSIKILKMKENKVWGSNGKTTGKLAPGFLDSIDCPRLELTIIKETNSSKSSSEISEKIRIALDLFPNQVSIKYSSLEKVILEQFSLLLESISGNEKVFLFAGQYNDVLHAHLQALASDNWTFIECANISNAEELYSINLSYPLQ
ncbi:hypothetical protein HDV04_000640 [Boothiomyces sp. JEL0838]|nr:hypothetical protein HDV04_000640 [Boothiomyces sp. JEL0838]